MDLTGILLVAGMSVLVASSDWSCAILVSYGDNCREFGDDVANVILRRFLLGQEPGVIHLHERVCSGEGMQFVNDVSFDCYVHDGFFEDFKAECMLQPADGVLYLRSMIRWGGVSPEVCVLLGAGWRGLMSTKGLWGEEPRELRVELRFDMLV